MGESNAIGDIAVVPASPCTSICLIGADGFCEGCGRSLGEIAVWPSASAILKQAIIDRIAAERHQ